MPREPDLPALPKVARVYYGPKGILIAAGHHDVKRSQGEGEPMILLPQGAEAELIGEQALRSLRESRSRLNQKELEDATAKMFQLAVVTNCIGTTPQLSRR
ncbi:MAG: hypothetical protein HY040_17720 [Planctomycetes bacterium]|nr:hypothetical protein [Planctomycetota bacterium]